MVSGVQHDWIELLPRFVRTSDSPNERVSLALSRIPVIQNLHRGNPNVLSQCIVHSVLQVLFFAIPIQAPDLCESQCNEYRALPGIVQKKGEENTRTQILCSSRSPIAGRTMNTNNTLQMAVVARARQLATSSTLHCHIHPTLRFTLLHRKPRSQILTANLPFFNGGHDIFDICWASR